MTLKVATLPWLLAHELRLSWRERRGKRMVAIGVLALMLTLVTFALVNDAQVDFKQVITADPLPPQVLGLAIQGMALGFVMAFLQALRASTITLFERGDLDLLVSSPLSSRVIFASRLLGMAVGIFFTIGAFVLIPGLIVIALGWFRLLGLFPTLLALCLLGTSLALLTNLVLMRFFGPGRTRTLASLMVIPAILLVRYANAQPQQLAELSQRFPLLAADSWLWFPTRAIFSDPLALLMLFGVTTAVVWLTVETLQGWFMAGTRVGPGTNPTTQAPPGSTTPEQETLTFQSGLPRLVLEKEWRVMRREPDLLPRLALAVVLLVPLVGSVFQPGEPTAESGAMLPGVIVVMAMAVTTALANLSICGEEAPELLQAAPVAAGQLRFLKLLAVLIPTWVVMVPLVVLLALQGTPGLALGMVVVVVTVATALLRLWNGKPVPAAGLRRGRLNPSRDRVLSLLEWANYGICLVLGLQLTLAITGLGIIALALLGLLMAGAYGRYRQLEPSCSSGG
jgi:ABC-2 type transport system permease protein